MSDRTARVAKALAEVHFVQTLLGPHMSAERVLAEEVRLLQGFEDRQQERIRKMVADWREVAAERRKMAEGWRAQGESFAWHAIRADQAADIIETQASVLESLLKGL